MISNNVKLYCNEDITKIDNYEQAINDTTQTWVCHHKNEIELNLSFPEIIKLGLYYNRPASELIFLTKSEHNTLHHKDISKPCSKEKAYKISETLKEKYKNGYINPRLGKHSSEETRKKISNALRGKDTSEETRKKISNALRGEKHFYYGKHRSEETRKKISNALRGKKLSEERIQKLKERKVSEETRKKISNALRGKHLSEETKQKIREVKKHISEETREKLRLAAKRQWEKYHNNKKCAK